MADTKKIVNIDERTWSYNDIQYWVNPADKTANAMINFNDKLARLRAGIIILKNDTILLGEEADEPGVFSLPGGGLEKGETPVDAAEREAQEEVYINVKNARDTEYDYCECHTELKKWVKDNVPKSKQWYNYYTCLIIAEYDSDYLGKVDNADKDPAMNGSCRWYKIKDVINKPGFKKQWKKALIDYGYYIELNEAVNYNDLITIHKELDSGVTDDELKSWYRLNENVSLDKDGNFVSDIDANFKMGENYHLFDFDFKKITPDMYKTVEEQSFANTDDFKDEYAVSWWDGDKLVAVVSEFDDAYGKRWLSYIEVTEPYRGHNLSTELLNYAVNGLGCTMLGVAKSNKVAIKVYQDYGFKIIGDNPNNSKQYWMQTISSLRKKSNKLNEDYSKDTNLKLKINGKVIGKAMIRDYQDGDIFLTDFVISPEFRGKGYGKKSFDMLVNKYGVNCLTVNPENFIALNMYKKFGFKQASEPYWDENGKETVIYMKKDLKESLHNLTANNDKANEAIKLSNYYQNRTNYPFNLDFPKI